MDATAESTTVVREIAIAARPETVWELLVDPDQAVRWMGMTASFDLRPGGTYRVEVIPGVSTATTSASTSRDATWSFPMGP